MPAARPIRVATPPKREPKRGCDLGDLFQLLGEPHVLDLLYLFQTQPGPKRFVQLQNELQLSPNTLSDRLRSLVRAGLLFRAAFNEIPPRVEYTLTPKAAELESAFAALSEWSRRNNLQPVAVTTPR